MSFLFVCLLIFHYGNKMPIQIPKWWIPIDWTTHMRKGFRAKEFFWRTSDAIQITEHLVCYAHITLLVKYWGGSFSQKVRIENRLRLPIYHANMSIVAIPSDFIHFNTYTRNNIERQQFFNKIGKFPQQKYETLTCYALLITCGIAYYHRVSGLRECLQLFFN